jgi:hypothetical protein
MLGLKRAVSALAGESLSVGDTGESSSVGDAGEFSSVGDAGGTQGWKRRRRRLW